MNNLDNVFGFSKPFKRIDYVAMLLFSTPYDYTNDYEDNKIHYGEELINLRCRLAYLQYLRFLKSKGIEIDKNPQINKLFNEKRWEELLNELDKYNVGEEIVDGGPWRYFRSHSHESTGIGFHSKDVKHRLYLNVALKYRALFAKTFIEYCVKNAIPYYFKVLTRKGQTDTIVIYIDTDDNLKSTIDIINRIYKEHTYFSSVTKKPPGHLYLVNDYIGYGFEPPVDENGEKQSYTQFMKSCVTIPISEKINKLKLRILNDFNNGVVYPLNNNLGVVIPSQNEIIGFAKLSKIDKLSFFRKYFQYILAIYGNEITNIMDELEQNANNKLELNTKIK